MRSWIPLFLEVSRTRASSLVTSANPSTIGRFFAKLSSQAHDCRRKYREWRSYVTITTVVAIVSCLGLLFTIANLPPAFQTKVLAQWTAKKDFREWCANEEVSLSGHVANCISILDQPLRPPPVIRQIDHTPSARVSLQNSTANLNDRPSSYPRVTLLISLTAFIFVCLYASFMFCPYMRPAPLDRPPDAESEIGFSGRPLQDFPRNLARTTAISTAVPSSIETKAKSSGIRSRKPVAPQRKDIKIDALKEYERRFLDAERSKAEPRFQAAQDSSLFCVDGRYFALTLKLRDPVTTQRRYSA